jgi:hypothetical protein
LGHPNNSFALLMNFFDVFQMFFRFWFCFSILCFSFILSSFCLFVCAAELVLLKVLQQGIEKTSLDYCRDWEEAVYYAYSDVPSAASERIPAHLVQWVMQVVFSSSSASAAASSGNAAAAAEEAEGAEGADTQSESFTTQAKALQLACALLQGDQEACFFHSSTSASASASPAESQVAAALLRMLLAQEPAALVSPFRTTRMEVAFLLAALSETQASTSASASAAGVVELCLKLVAACDVASVLRGSSASAFASSGASAGAGAGIGASITTAMDVTAPAAVAVAAATAAASATATAQQAAQDATTAQGIFLKNAAETVCIVLQCAVHKLPMWRFNGAWGALFTAALIGAGSMTSSAIETAKMCYDTCLLVANSVTRSVVVAASASSSSSSDATSAAELDIVGQLLHVLYAQAQNTATPLHSRETLMRCAALVMGNSWGVLTLEEKKVRTWFGVVRISCVNKIADF